MTRLGRIAFLIAALLSGTAQSQAQSPAQSPAQSSAQQPAQSQTLRLHPDNPRYFLFQGKPTVVITSGEHYGALLNLDFDYRRYFSALAADGLNGTRVFSGTYVASVTAINSAGRAELARSFRVRRG